jgi:hypothetical protein
MYVSHFHVTVYNMRFLLYPYALHAVDKEPQNGALILVR